MSDVLATARAALIAAGAPKDEVRFLRPGRWADTLIHLVVFGNHSWQEANKIARNEEIEFTVKDPSANAVIYLDMDK